MRKQPSVTFVKAFIALEQAEDWAKQILGPFVIIHLYQDQENQMYAVCDRAAIDMIQETLDEYTQFLHKNIAMEIQLKENT